MSRIDELVKRRNEAERDYSQLEYRLEVLKKIKEDCTKGDVEEEYINKTITKLEAEKRSAQRIFESLDEQICQTAY